MGDSVIGDTLCISESSDPKKMFTNLFFGTKIHIFMVLFVKSVTVQFGNV